MLDYKEFKNIKATWINKNSEEEFYIKKQQDDEEDALYTYLLICPCNYKNSEILRKYNNNNDSDRTNLKEMIIKVLTELKIEYNILKEDYYIEWVGGSYKIFVDVIKFKK